MVYANAAAFMDRKREEYADVVRVLRALERFDTWDYECERADGSRCFVHRLWMLPQAVQDEYSVRLFGRVRDSMKTRPEGSLLRALGVTDDEHAV